MTILTNLADRTAPRLPPRLLPLAPMAHNITWEDLVVRGGYPFPALHLDTRSDREAWFEAYLRSYLERDLRQLAAIGNLVGFLRLVRVVAQRLGGLMNQAGLARNAGLPPPAPVGGNFRRSVPFRPNGHDEYTIYDLMDMHKSYTFVAEKRKPLR